MMWWGKVLGYLLIITPWKCMAITNKRPSTYDEAGSVRNFRHIAGPSAEPLADWEAGLREAVLQSLLREHHRDAQLRDRLRAAPLIGRRDAGSAFGDVVVLARGQLYATGAGNLAFVQDRRSNDCDDCYNARRCDRHQCQAWTPKNRERLLALWTVKRLRHRDSHDQSRFEIEYTVSPLNDATRDVVIRKGRFNYAIPGHVFVVRSGETGKKAADKYDREIYNRKEPHHHYLPNIPIGYDSPGHQHILHSYPGFFTSDSARPPHQKVPTTTDPKEIELYKKLIEALASKTSTTVKTEEQGPQRVSLNHYGGITTPQGSPITESAAMKNLTTSAMVSTSSTKTSKTQIVTQISTRYNVTSSEATKGTMPTKKYQVPTKKPVYTLPKTEKSKPMTKPTKPQLSVPMKAGTTPTATTFSTATTIVTTPSSTRKPTMNTPALQTTAPLITSTRTTTTSATRPQTIAPPITSTRTTTTSAPKPQTIASSITSTRVTTTSTPKPQTLAPPITSTRTTTTSAPKPQTIASSITSTRVTTTSTPKPQTIAPLITSTRTTTTSAPKPQTIASPITSTTTSASKPQTIAYPITSTTTTTSAQKPQTIAYPITSTTTTTSAPKPQTIASQITSTTTSTNAPKPSSTTTTTTTSASKLQTITSYTTSTTTTTNPPKPQIITSHTTSTTSTSAPKSKTTASHITSTTSTVTPQSTSTSSTSKPSTIVSHTTKLTTNPPLSTLPIKMNMTTTTTTSSNTPTAKTELPSSQTIIFSKATTTPSTTISTTPTTVTSTSKPSGTLPAEETTTSTTNKVPSSSTTSITTTVSTPSSTTENGSMTTTSVPQTTITKFSVGVSSVASTTLETTSEMPQSHSVSGEMVNNDTATTATIKETVYTESTTFELEKATEPTNQMPAPSTEPQTTPFSDVSTTTKDTQPEADSKDQETTTTTNTSGPTSTKAAPTSKVPKTTTASDFLTDVEPIKDPINTKPVKEDYDLDDIFGSTIVTTKPASTTTTRVEESDLAVQLFGNKQIRNAKVIFSNFYEASTSTMLSNNGDITEESEPITSQSFETSVSYQVNKRRAGQEVSSTARSGITRRKPKRFKYRRYKPGAAKIPPAELALLDTTTYAIVTATTNPSRSVTESGFAVTESMSESPDAPGVEYTESTLSKPTQSRETTESSGLTTESSSTEKNEASAKEVFDDLAMRLVNHARGIDYMSKRTSRPSSPRYKKRTYSPRSRKTTRKRIRNS